MKKICLTLCATVILTLGAMAQSTPVQEQEKMSEPEQNMELRNKTKEDGVGKAADTDQSDADKSDDPKERKTVTQKDKKNKPGRRSQADEDETGKKRKNEKENPE